MSVEKIKQIIAYHVTFFENQKTEGIQNLTRLAVLNELKELQIEILTAEIEKLGGINE